MKPEARQPAEAQIAWALDWVRSRYGRPGRAGRARAAVAALLLRAAIRLARPRPRRSAGARR